MQCQYCKQPVRGGYIQALGAIWHPEHFLCAGCGQPIGESKFQIFQNQPYHEACYLNTQAPRCAHCGQPISGAYTEYQGQRYHTTCYQDSVAPRCAHCGQSISGAYTEYQGQHYHTLCYNEYVAPRCVYCHKSLTSSYLVDEWNNKYCTEHEKEYPRCSFCGRLIPPYEQTAGWNIYDSQRCPTCRATAIESIEQAQPFFQKCKQWISGQGFRFNQLPLRLELHDRAWLLALWPDRSVKHPRGVTLTSRRSENGYVLSSQIEGVAVLQGMPATLFSGIVLHELGHVWLTVQRVEGLPQWEEEGFCQLISYQYYRDLNTPEARYHATSLQTSTDPIYGEGFRRIYALSEKSGFANFVEVLRTTKRLPDGSIR